MANNLLCKKQLEEIVSFSSLATEDLLHLKSLIMYTLFLLKKLTAYHYRALDAMVTLAVSSGWNTIATPLSQRNLDCRGMKEKSATPIFSEDLESNRNSSQGIVSVLTNLSDVVYHSQQRVVQSVVEKKIIRDKVEPFLASSWLERSQDWLYRHIAKLAMGGAVIGGGLAMAWGFIKWRFAPPHRRCSKASVFFSALKSSLAQAVEEPFSEKTQKSPLKCLTKISGSSKPNTEQKNLDLLGNARWDSQSNLLFLDYLIRRTWTGKRDTPPLDRYSSAPHRQEQLTELATNFKHAIKTSQERGVGENENSDQLWITRQSDPHNKNYCVSKR